MRSVCPFIAAAGVLALVSADFAAADAAQPTTIAMSASAPDNDAAAKHAKRTACLKEAKAKKIVGAQKTAFIKECMARP